MKQLKILLLALSISITLLLTFIISYLEPYELLFREYIYLIAVIQCLVLFIICLITLLVIHGIKYYNSNIKLEIDLNNHLDDYNKRTNLILNEYKNKVIIESINFKNKKSIFSIEHRIQPEYIITLNNQKYKVIHKFRTDLSDKDIYGLKWDYIFIDNNYYNTTKTKYSFQKIQSLLEYESSLRIGDIVDLNRSLYKTELFNHETQYSKADILGSKYVFIWQSNK